MPSAQDFSGFYNTTTIRGKIGDRCTYIATFTKAQKNTTTFNFSNKCGQLQQHSTFTNISVNLDPNLDADSFHRIGFISMIDTYASIWLKFDRSQHSSSKIQIIGPDDTLLN